MQLLLLSFLVLFLALAHLITHWLHTRKQIPYWLCALGIAALAPVATLSIYMPIGHLLFTRDMHAQVNTNATFLLFVLLVQASGFFLYGGYKHLRMR